ncbi:MAG TPA: SRPBCC domain-containing protein [Polyangiales bacterium]|nr:SRPBCC domain-containing protein [Polyangiales bacterium]
MTDAQDRVRVTVSVAIEPELAFRVFTEEIDQWWKRGPAYRSAKGDRGFLHLEPGVGGRLFESFETDSGTRVLQTGEVKVWDPPSRLVFDWRAVNFAPAEKTEVEVCFEPTPTGTLVTLTHRGWDSIRKDHPVRHREEPQRFLRNMGMWWSSLLTSMRAHARERSHGQS